MSNILEIRVNKYGNNPQERALNKRIRAFNKLKERSPNSLNFIDMNNDNQVGVFSPSTQDQQKIIYKLLVDRDIEISGGTILNLLDNDWICLNKNDNHSAGYSKFYFIKTNKTINWTYNEVSYSARVYYQGALSKVRSDQRQFGGLSLFYELNDTDFIIMQTNDNFKKDVYFTIGDLNYEVENSDNNTLPGISYVCLRQTHKKNKEKIPISPDSTNVNDFWLK
jgi:hypothetical protein